MGKWDFLMALREFNSVKVGDRLPDRTYPLTRQDLVNYAGVSGDLNPIHWDDEIAKVVGLDTAIAHGMLTTCGSPPWCRCPTTARAPSSFSAAG
jgi:acyl dehydratase